MKPIAYQIPMNGQEIADYVGITRQAVSYTLRKSLNKMYSYVLQNDLADSPFDAIIVLMKMLRVTNGNTTDVFDFLSYFNKDIQNDVKSDAVKIYG